MTYPDWKETRDGMWAAGRQFPMIDEDTPTFLGQKHAREKADLAGADVVIIGSPYVSSSSDEWAGIGKEHWLAAPQRVRQQLKNQGTTHCNIQAGICDGPVH